MKLFFFIVLYFFISGFIRAGGLSIYPVRIHLAIEKPIQTLKINNESDSPVVYQFQPYHWSQDFEAVDCYERTSDLIIAPEIIRLAPRGSQVVRIAYRQALYRSGYSAQLNHFSQKELTYRVILREVHQKDRKEEQSEKGQLKVSLAVNFPVFIYHSGISSQAQYLWKIETDSLNIPILKITNTGKSHILINKISFSNLTGQVIQEKDKLFKYVLPGATGSIILDFPVEIFQDVSNLHTLKIN